MSFNIQKIAFYFLIVFLFSIANSIAVLQIAAGGLFLLWVFDKERTEGLNTVLFYSIGAFILIRIVSALVSPYKQGMEIFYKEILFYLIVPALFTLVYKLETKKFITVLHLYSLAGVITSIFGIILFNLGTVHRAESFSSGYMAFSTYLLSPLAVLSFLDSPHEKLDKKYWWMKSVSIALILTAIITSLGRINIVIAFFIAGAAIVLRGFKIKELLLVIVITVPMVLLSFMNNSEEAEKRVSNPSAFSDRDIIYQGAQDLMFERPLFGFGPKTFTEIFPHREKFGDVGIASWHNDFLQTYFESGIPGLLSFISLFMLFFYMSFKKIFIEKNTHIIKGISLSVLCLFLTSFTSGFITNITLSIVFAFSAALFSRECFKSTVTPKIK